MRMLDAKTLLANKCQNNVDVETSQDVVDMYAKLINPTNNHKKDIFKELNLDFVQKDAYMEMFKNMPESWQQNEIKKIFGKVE